MMRANLAQEEIWYYAPVFARPQSHATPWARRTAFLAGSADMRQEKAQKGE